MSEDDPNNIDDRASPEYKNQRADGDTEQVVFPRPGHAFVPILERLVHCTEVCGSGVNERSRGMDNVSRQSCILTNHLLLLTAKVLLAKYEK